MTHCFFKKLPNVHTLHAHPHAHYLSAAIKRLIAISLTKLPNIDSIDSRIDYQNLVFFCIKTHNLGFDFIKPPAGPRISILRYDNNEAFTPHSMITFPCGQGKQLFQKLLK